MTELNGALETTYCEQLCELINVVMDCNYNDVYDNELCVDDNRCCRVSYDNEVIDYKNRRKFLIAHLKDIIKAANDGIGNFDTCLGYLCDAYRHDIPFYDEYKPFIGVNRNLNNKWTVTVTAIADDTEDVTCYVLGQTTKCVDAINTRIEFMDELQKLGLDPKLQSDCSKIESIANRYEKYNHDRMCVETIDANLYKILKDRIKYKEIPIDREVKKLIDELIDCDNRKDKIDD